MKTIEIDGRTVGRGHPALVIAEIGVNHDGSLQRALELVQHAKAAGADAVKLQIFQASQLMHSSSSFADYQRDRVDQPDPTAMLRQYELSFDQCGQIVRAIRESGMIPLATPFSPGDVDAIEALDLPAIKIASPDLVNRMLLARAARSGRPIIVSTGAATMEEVERTVGWLNALKCPQILMHCVSSYPVPTDQANLCWISELSAFGVPVGYSDHATEPLAGAISVSLGACVVEKHLTYDRNAAGPDHSASADPVQLAEYVRAIRSAESLAGRPGKCVLPIELDVRTVSRQSVVLSRAISAGELIHADDLTVQRPGTGIAPAELSAIVGCVARRKLVKGTLLQWDMLADAA